MMMAHVIFKYQHFLIWGFPCQSSLYEKRYLFLFTWMSVISQWPRIFMAVYSHDKMTLLETTIRIRNQECNTALDVLSWIKALEPSTLAYKIYCTIFLLRQCRMKLMRFDRRAMQRTNLTIIVYWWAEYYCSESFTFVLYFEPNTAAKGFYFYSLFLRDICVVVEF